MMSCLLRRALLLRGCASTAVNNKMGTSHLNRQKVKVDVVIVLSFIG